MLPGQIVFRGALALLLISLLGAASTIPFWNYASTVARPLMLLLFALVTFHVTRKIDPVYSVGGRIVFTLLNWLLLLATFTVVWSIDRIETATTIFGLAALLFVVQRSSSRRWRDRGVLAGDLKTIVWVISTVLFLGVVTESLGVTFQSTSGRFQGLLNNPNIAAQIAALTLAIGWGVYREQGGWPNLLMLLPSSLTIVLTETRTTFIAIGVALMWLLAKKGKKGILIGLGVSVPIALLIYTFGLGPLRGTWERFGEASPHGDSFSGRTFIWSSGFDLIRSMPYGTGWGSNTAVAEKLGGFENYHNSFIHTAVEGGVMAPLLLVSIYLTIFFVLLRLPTLGLNSGIHSAIVLGIVVQFMESGVFGVGQPFPYLFWFSIGGAIALDGANGEKGNISLRQKEIGCATKQKVG